MSVRREIECNVCGERTMEHEPNDGWQGWGQLRGVVLDGVADPHLCPECLKVTAVAADARRYALQHQRGWDHTVDEGG
jgi:hypothetical protein